jgi:hypothetical protein
VQSIRLPQETKKKENLRRRLQLLLLSFGCENKNDPKTTVDSPKRREDETPRINDEDKGYLRTTATTTHDGPKRKTVSSKERSSITQECHKSGPRNTDPSKHKNNTTTKP